VAWTDSASFRANNCKATNDTNGVDHYATSSPASIAEDSIDHVKARKQPLNVIIDATTPSNAVLPSELAPALPLLGGSYEAAQFYYLNETRTGVLALGSFIATSITEFQQNLLTGLQNLKAAGAKQLIIDVTNNSGGYVCIVHWLHRIIAGAKNTTDPQAGLYIETRAQPLARAITAAIANGADPNIELLYEPVGLTFGNNTLLPEKYDWLKEPVRKVINGHEDFFSQKLGRQCQPFSLDPPAEGLFDPKTVAIVSNGRCPSSCALLSVSYFCSVRFSQTVFLTKLDQITMSKQEGAKTVVFGGRNTVQQQYCGTVGGESSDFATINSDIKSTKLKDHPLSPPDLLTHTFLGVTRALGFGVWNPEEPEEWQDHPADVNLALTKQNVNNPFAIWNDVVEAVF
jgi:hypothetical protein